MDTQTGKHLCIAWNGGPHMSAEAHQASMGREPGMAVPGRLASQSGRRAASQGGAR